MRVATSEELRAKLDKHQRLMTATVEVTRRCNLRCVHCLRAPDNAQGLSAGEICRVLDELAGLGCMTLTLTGGEPLARRDLLDIASHAWDRRLAVTIMTNGTLLTGEMVAALQRLHVQELQVSVYAADPAIHDAVTGDPGSHQRTREGIALARAGGLKVRVAMPLLSTNAGQAPAVEEWCRSQGLPFLPGALIFPRNDGDRQPLALLPSSQQMAAVIKTEDSVAHAQPAPAAVLCSAGRDRLAISADGDIYPCDAWRLPLGNVQREHLADVWFSSPVLSAIRAERRQHPAACAGCGRLAQCVWCPGLSFGVLGDATRPNAQDCRRTRLSFASPAPDAPGWAPPAELQAV